MSTPGRSSAQAARFVHPGAWWLWACCLAAAVTRTTNPVLLLLALTVVVLVVIARRPDAPWARSFTMYAWLGLFVIVTRMVLFVLIGSKTGPTILVTLPTVDLPSWAAGIQLLGPIPLEDLIAALCEGLRLATMLLCFGAANVLANPRRLLRALPAAVRDIGTAVVIALTVVPQLAESAKRVARARELRGTSVKGVRALRVIALPVLQDTLDRSLLLAASMDSRGFGTRHSVSHRDRRLVGVLSLGGLMAVCVGLYGLLDDRGDEAIPLWATVATVAGLVLGALAVWWGGRRVPRSVYRSDPWKSAETIVSLCGVTALVAMIVALERNPLATIMPLEPTLGTPLVPLTAVLGLLVAALPAFVTPPLPPKPKRGPRQHQQMQEIS